MQSTSAYLMLHRIKKKNDLNHDKWIGIGGKFEENETPEECMRREAMEETGLELTGLRLRGIITFLSNEYEGEYMYLFTATGFRGEMTECNEGTLEWVKKEDVKKLPMWEGDHLFFEELDRNRGFFTMKLRYEGDTLAEHDLHLY